MNCCAASKAISARCATTATSSAENSSTFQTAMCCAQIVSRDLGRGAVDGIVAAVFVADTVRADENAEADMSPALVFVVKQDAGAALVLVVPAPVRGVRDSGVRDEVVDEIVGRIDGLELLRK